MEDHNEMHEHPWREDNLATTPTSSKEHTKIPKSYVGARYVHVRVISLLVRPATQLQVGRMRSDKCTNRSITCPMYLQLIIPADIPSWLDVICRAAPEVSAQQHYACIHIQGK